MTNPQQAVPQLFENEFPDWFAGVAFAAIVIGALVPAAIMSIAAANLWTRNIYKAFINRDATHAQEAQQSKVASLLVKFGALVFVLALSNDVRDQPPAARRRLDPADASRRSWSASTRAGSTAGRCSPAGPSAWPTAPGSRTAYPKVGDPGSHFGGPLDEFPGTDTKSTSRFIALLLNLRGGGRADAWCCGR